MTGTNTEPAATPATEVVEEINLEKMSIEDAIVNDDGVVTQYHDREANKIYYRKGSEPAPSKAPDAAPDKDATPGADDGQGANSDGDDSGQDPDEGSPEVEYENVADHMLKLVGYEGTKVKIGEEEVEISSLTPEQQLEIVGEEFNNILAGYEQKIKELESRPAKLDFQDPMAQQVVEYLQKGGDLKALAKEILTQDPAARAQMMSDEEVVKASIRKQFAKYSDEEVDAEFKEMSDAMKARRAKHYRAQMAEEKPDLSTLTKAQQAAIAAEELRMRQSFDQEVETLKTKSREVKEIAGIPINEQMHNYLISKTVPKDFKSDSEFVQSIQQNPVAIYKLKFWDTWGEKLLEQTREVFYRKGLQEGQKGKEKLSDAPIKSYGAQGTKNARSSAPMKSLDEMSAEEFAKWIDAGAKF